MKIQFFQTKRFSKDLERLLDKRSLLREDFDTLKKSLTENPKLGDSIPGCAGVRKIRLKTPSKGKSGGFRICYYYYQENEWLYLIMIYPKNVQEDLTSEQKKTLKELAYEIKEK